MTRLESTKKINSLKMTAIRNGGYIRFKKQILEMCAKHKEFFGIDLTPKQLM